MISNVSHTRNGVFHTKKWIEKRGAPEFFLIILEMFWKSDGTLFQVFAIASQTNNNFWRNLKQTKLYDN